MNRITFNRSPGFTMIEVLVALVILSIGLIGVAAMGATSIVNTHSSQEESLMASEARSISDAMQANYGYWGIAGQAPPSLAVASSTLSGDSTLESDETNCSTTTCAPVDLAAYDLKAWGSQLSSLNSTAQAQIGCISGAPIICTIRVNWVPQSSVALNSGTQNTSPATAATVAYTVTAQISNHQIY
jgi:type IV pilus assembly protein PilV